jgi:hypothetical protein
VIARGSAFECVAILEYLQETKEITQQDFLENEQRLQEISKMLFGLIKNLDLCTRGTRGQNRPLVSFYDILKPPINIIKIICPAKCGQVVRFLQNTFYLPYICFADGTIITFSSGSGMSGSSGKIGLTTRL